VEYFIQSDFNIITKISLIVFERTTGK